MMHTHTQMNTHSVVSIGAQMGTAAIEREMSDKFDIREWRFDV